MSLTVTELSGDLSPSLVVRLSTFGRGLLRVVELAESLKVLWGVIISTVDVVHLVGVLATE